MFQGYFEEHFAKIVGAVEYMSHISKDFEEERPILGLDHVG